MSLKFAMLSLSVFATSCVLIVGCEKQENVEVRASAAVEASTDGSVSVRKPTRQEVARLNEDDEKRKVIDARFPGSQTPWGEPSERVIGIFAPGIIELQNGRKVKMDGVRCGEKGVIYLRRLLQDETTTVVILSSTGSQAQAEPIPAEVWSTDSALSMKNLSNVTEIVIESGWCEVEATPTCNHNERYAALAQAFQAAKSIR